MYIKLEDEIININMSQIEKIHIKKTYHNNIDDDSKSGFKYGLFIKTNENNSFSDGSILQSYETKEAAEEVLRKIATKVDAINI